MTKEEIKIKELISGQVDMGTFGLVELELRELVKSVESERINGKEAELSGIIYDLKKQLSEQQSKHEQEMKELEILRDLNQWNFLANKKPNAFEKGDWDGLRTDPILVQDKDGNSFIAIMYEGFLDGNKFCEFYETTYDFCIANVIKWKKI